MVTATPATTALLSGVSNHRPASRPISEPLQLPQPLITLDDQQLKRRFDKEDKAVTLKNVRRLCIIAIILVPLAIVLDWFAYPQLLQQFMVLRITSSLLLVPVLWLTYTRWGQRHYRKLTVIVPMVPAFFISLMIRESGDPSSGYYAGLTLCLVALALMFHWTHIESIVAVALVLTMYIAAIFEPLMHGMKPGVVGAFINNCVFILLNSVVIISASFYHRHIRVREFLTRVEVEQQREALTTRNDELTETLKQLRETENQLVQSEKLASLGRMSAGIIHEINNPLSYTNQALFVLKKKTKDLPEEKRAPIERIIGDIKDGITRVSSIISDLRSFSHPDSGHLTEVSLADTVFNALRILGNSLSDADVSVETGLDETLIVQGDKNHIIQILINLIQNAIHAVKDKPERLITIRAQVDGDRTQLVVRDNGTGIPHSDLPKIFDPFFTTKDVGEGMGMGLSICFRLMQQMRGTIEASSHPGHWTEFTLTFYNTPPPPSGIV